MKKIFLLMVTGLLALGLAGCKNEKPEPAAQAPAQPMTPPAATQGGATQTFNGTVTETMDASGYTYVQVDTGSEKIWAAAPQFKVQVGDQVAVPSGMAMQDYHSKTLDRDFPVVYFVSGVMVGGGEAATPSGMASMPEGHPPINASASPAGEQMDFSGLKAADGGKTVEQIYQDPAGLSGKEVKIRGKVVKFNSGIMGKNWIHIQDGSGAEGTNDLTVTTQEMANVGDTVLVNGVIATDKDFGYGYKYNVLIEDAKVTVE